MASVLSFIFYLFVSLLIFGLIIFVHEFGHFITAKLFKVRVIEFALGMGPTIFKRQKDENSTVYALRLLPIGGFCAMEGEDEEVKSENSFGSKPVWQRIIILAAGAIMNFIAGLVILLILYSSVKAFSTPTISGFADGFPYQGETMLMEGDKILKINDYPIYLANDVSIFLTHDEGAPYDIEVMRDGQKLRLTGVPLERRLYKNEDGTESMRFGIGLGIEAATPFTKIKVACLNAFDFVRLIKVSLFDLISGKAGVSDLSGPVGMVGQITETAKRSLADTWLFTALISINLGVMNLLPLPALDGGRIIFLLIELVRRKPVSPKYEGMVHLVGFALLMALMLYVSFNDIVRLVSS
ncbi:site-2 protease family protein [Oscillospiraceae bacterium OttesenSCG-928-G22]|nr:site-2 protease family protein [Oscillospiraceae bacterium OttesenSCG-928-G22]